MLLNRQRAVRIANSGLNAFLARALRTLRIPRDALTICLVTNSQIARWNRDFRGKNGPTDVLSFPADGARRRTPAHSGNPKRRGAAASPASFTSLTSSSPYLGDIAIAPAVASKNAARFGGTLDHELRILILHGILHLVGYDHETDSGQMDRREKRLRRALGLS
jgi:probable rRNA maturation factor